MAQTLQACLFIYTVVTYSIAWIMKHIILGGCMPANMAKLDAQSHMIPKRRIS